MEVLMKVIFPADNILAKLCDEQKFFKKHIDNFSNIIPYCELLVDDKFLTKALHGSKFIIKKTSIKETSVIKKCVAKKNESETLIGYFILGTFQKSKKKQIAKLILKNQFEILSFNTFYTCELIINADKFFSWRFENIKWYKNKPPKQPKT